VGDWWQAFQHGDRVAILAHRREEVDQFNTACQQLRDHAGHLGPDRLQVDDRQFAVGDLVVCGKNTLRTVGVANGSRGQILALDLTQRTMTLRMDNGQEATLDGRYLDHRPAWWTRGNPGRRTVDLGYATTGHRS
jgi:ATP-dependent exoDNAse (exonuclease V) alpha subunit